MSARLSREAWLVIAALAFLGCPKDETGQESAPVSSSTHQSATAARTTAETASVAASTSTSVAPGAPGTEARAKAALDGKGADPAYQGKALTAGRGTNAMFVVPLQWKRSIGAWSTAIAPDEASRFAAGGYDGNAAAKLNEAAGAVGLSDCEWSAGESASIGKDRLPATVYDGMCKRGATTVKTAATTLTSNMSTMAVGGWDDGTDSKTLFDIFRSVRRVKGIDERMVIAACCAALRQDGGPIEWEDRVLAAVAVCDQALKNRSSSRAALSAVRVALGGVPVPAACRR